MGTMEPGEIDRQERSGFPAAFAAGAGVVLVLAAGLVLLTRSTTQSRRTAVAEKLPFGPPEQAYARRIHFHDIQMAQSSNLLNQEFTYVAGTISNGGDRTVRALEATFEFRDQFNQVILRETERLITRNAQPLSSGQDRDFQIILEHIPSDWNRQYPSIRITGLILE
jgi:hypothetical protein